jgi:trehalose synthase
MRLVIGDALHSLGDLGTGALRLDANGFLGVEKSADGRPAWSEGHPLSEAANHLIASMVRKVGGFTFQELNLTIDDIRTTGEAGADLSYDFINRPAYQHALATADTEFLRLTLNLSLTHGVAPKSLVLAMQNHDELTYELVHFATVHKDDPFTFHRRVFTGGELAERVRQDMIDRLTGEAAPYNAIFTTNGIASTTATVILASLGIRSFDDLNEETIERVRRAHLLLAMFNALQPGVFALSGWDLCGMLTLDRSAIEQLLASGDTRWIHRSAYDLMNYAPEAQRSTSGMPRGVSLYGDLPTQLGEPTSFVSRLRRILEVREGYGLATADQIDVPAVSHRSMLVMAHQLPDPTRLQVTVLNFAAEPISGTVRSQYLLPGAAVSDMFSDRRVAEVDDLNSFSVALEAHEGLSLLITAPAPRDM